METPKYLDINVDFKLNYKLHITLIENKVARSVGILSKLRYLFLSTTILAHSAPTLFTGQLKNMLKRLNLGINFLSDLARSG